MEHRRSRIARIASALLVFVASALVATPAWSYASNGPTWPDVAKRLPIQAEGDRDAAVIVGIEDYAYVPKVPGAARNATDWYVFLTESRRVSAEHTHLLRDREATREQILDQVSAAALEVKSGGTLWVVFIGHGAPSSDGREGVLVGVDAQGGATPLYARSLRQSELLGAAAKTEAAHTVAIVDACFSGRAGDGTPLAPGLQPLIPVRARTAPFGANVTVASAGRADQFAGSLPGLGRPAFSYLVLGAMRGWADEDGDHVVTLKEAVAFADRSLKVLVMDRAQTPQIFGGEPDLALARSATEISPDLREFALAQQAVAAAPPAQTTQIAPSTDMVLPLRVARTLPAAPMMSTTAATIAAPAPRTQSRASALMARCNANYPESCAALGAMFEVGAGGVAQSDEGAVAYYQRACDGGSKRACAWFNRPAPIYRNSQPRLRAVVVNASLLQSVLGSR